MKIKIYLMNKPYRRCGIIKREKDNMTVMVEYKDGRSVELEFDEEDQCIEFHDGKTRKILNTWKLKRR